MNDIIGASGGQQGGLRGELFRGTERVTTNAALQYYGLSNGDAKLLKSRMLADGWRGPTKLWFSDGCTRAGYVRMVTSTEEFAGSSKANLPAALQEGCELSLIWCHKVLRRQIDVENGNLCRAQTSAAQMMLTGQLRADEARLKAARTEDVLDRLEKLLRETEKRIPLEPTALPPKE